VPAARRPALAHIKEVRGVEYVVYPTVRKQKIAGSANREERVRMSIYNELIETYGYPAKRIDIEFPVKIRDDEQPRFADIVVFDDDEHKRPLIVVECKKPKRTDGERQGQRYATILRAVYVIWTNGTARSASVLVNRYPEEAVQIADVPPFRGEPKYEIAELRPFEDDKEVTSTIRRCHDLIRSIDKKKPDAAFDEFLKLLFVKFRDEREHEANYEVQVFLRGEPPVPEDVSETAQRIRALFHHAAVADAEISTVFSRYDDIELSNECLAHLTKLLQPYSFSATNVDQKAKAFETFLSSDMRQEFKEFMTPRRVVEAMVQMARPKTTHFVLDPCCGTASFLLYSLAYVRKQLAAKKLSEPQRIRQVFDFAHDHLWGFDASLQMANVARLNMLVNEDGRAHIFHHDALHPTSDGPALVQGRHFVSGARTAS
jgi:type I restriction enzyme M protein